jgi:hypothetical protein
MARREFLYQKVLHSRLTNAMLVPDCTLSAESVSLSLQDDHLAASAAHVACCMSTSACAGAKNWFIVVFVFAIYSVFLGLPGLLPVFM